MPRSIESINKKSGRIIKKLASLSAMNLVIGVAFQVLFLFSVLQSEFFCDVINILRKQTVFDEKKIFINCMYAELLWE